ncbi:DUF7194 family protein [Campylobacter coli]
MSNVIDNYILPSIESEGYFTFIAPFNLPKYEEKKYRVIAIRNVTDMINSNESPYDGIYAPAGLTEKDFLYDIERKVPIVVLMSNEQKYLYIPANRIKSLPTILGIEYQELILAVNLGPLPVDYDISIISKTITDDIYATSGIQSTVEKLKSSNIKLVDELEHKKYKQLLDNKKKVTKSYGIRYKELEKTYNSTRTHLQELERSFIGNIENFHNTVVGIIQNNIDKNVMIEQLQTEYNKIFGILPPEVETPEEPID